MLSLPSLAFPRISRSLKWTPFIPHIPTPKQLAFLLLDNYEEAFYGGAAGGGKSDALLMGALQYVDTPGYAALLLRRTFKALTLPEALLDRARMWLGGTGAKWNSDSNTWIFPSGARVVFGYLENDRDVEQYQSAAFQYCVAKGTPVLMANGEWKPIEDIGIGDVVQTLEGPQPVQMVYRLGRKRVARLSSALGEALVSAQHRLLTSCDGWRTPMELLSRRYPPCGNSGGYSLPKCAISSSRHGRLHLGQRQALSPYQQNSREMVDPDCAFSVTDGQNDCVMSEGEYPEARLQHKQGVPLVLYGQSPQLKEWNGAYHAVLDGVSLTKLQDFPIGYPLGRRSCDGQPRLNQVSAQDSTQQLAGVATQSHTCQRLGGQGYIHGRNLREYAHPYTMERRPIHGDVLSLLSDITLEGEAEVLDLTVSSCSHYIIYPGYVSSNCGFDELTQFSEYQYRYMHSRTRRLENSTIPIRIRGASNPGSIGHDWVKIRFIVEGLEKGRPFIPAKLDDNPHLDQAAYIKSLNNLDPVTRDQLLRGDWSARTAGSKFRREWFKLIDVAPNDCKYVRYWDMAATEKKANTDPDWTAGAKVGRNPQGNYFIADMRHARVTPQSVEALITQTAQLDGRNTWIYMEQEPGASGKTLVDYYGRKVLQGYTFYPDKVTGDKSSRANPVSSQAEAGNVYIVKGAWINDYLDEAESFPTGAHDDQVDAVSGAFTQLVIPGNPEGMLRAMELIIEQRAKVGSKP